MLELKRAGHQELIVRGLLAKAELNRIRRSYDEARATLDEAWDTAVRGQMRLHQADTCLQFAELYVAMNRLDAARQSFGEARQRILDMGYQRRDGKLKALAPRLQ